MDQAEQGVNQISEVVQANSATAQESSATSEELSAQAVSLDELISKYMKWYSLIVVENKVEYPLSPEHQHSCDSWFYIQGIGNIPVV